MKIASSPADDQQAQEWMARIGNTQKKGPDSVGEQLQLALKRLSDAPKCVELAGILDALGWPMRTTASRRHSETTKKMNENLLHNHRQRRPTRSAPFSIQSEARRTTRCKHPPSAGHCLVGLRYLRNMHLVGAWLAARPQPTTHIAPSCGTSRAVTLRPFAARPYTFAGSNILLSHCADLPRTAISETCSKSG
jgi:hypothetical protein